MAQFDNDHFIGEVERRPHIWNSNMEGFPNKIEKYKCWEELALIFFDNHETSTQNEKNENVKNLQRKWKSLRDCFSRELSTQKKEKRSGKANSHRKTYVYYQQLAFLNSVTTNKKSDSCVDQDQDDDYISKYEPELVTVEVTPLKHEGYDDSAMQCSSSNEQEISEPKRKRRKIRIKEEMEPEHKENPISNPVEDEDRLFLLSLVKDMNKISNNYKLDAKMEIIQVIKKWKNNSVTRRRRQSNFQSGTQDFTFTHYFSGVPNYVGSYAGGAASPTNSNKSGESAHHSNDEFI